MARIQHLAIASKDPEKQAAFYQKVFGFKEVRRLNNPRARGVVQPGKIHAVIQLILLKRQH